MGTTALLLGILDVTGVVQLWQVYVLAFVFGVMAAIDTPTRLSFVVEMVGPQALANAVALNSASVNAARLIGPAIGGLLIAAIGTGWVILIYAATAAVAIGFLTRIRAAELQPTSRVPRAKGQFREGIRYVRERPELRLVFVTVVILGTFAMTQDTLLPLMASQVFHGSAQLYGFLAAALAVGTLSGALLAARRARADVSWFTISCYAYGVLWLVAAAMPNVVSFALALPLLGVAQLSCITGANAIVQLSAAPEMRGRVMALYLTALLGGAPIGAPIVGWLAQTWSPRLGLAAAGVMTLLAASFGLLAFRRASAGQERMTEQAAVLAERTVPTTP
jgi:MFS family permease